MSATEIKVPNIGDAAEVEVIEVLVSPGDKINKDDSLITLESDKASMEIPSPISGTVAAVNVKVGDKVSEGSLIVTLQKSDSATSPKEEKKAPPAEKPEARAEATKEPSKPITTEQKVTIPDIGDAKNVEVIEVLVKPGMVVSKEDSLLTLEGEKATMEIPSPYAGEIKTIRLNVGDKVSAGDEILTMLVTSAPQQEVAKEEKQAPKQEIKKEDRQSGAPLQTTPLPATDMFATDSNVHAGPAVRRLAREFGIDLTKIKGTGPKNRILVEDLQKFVKSALSEAKTSAGGIQVPKMPAIDFSKFGEIEHVPLNKIKKLTGINVHRSWVTIPHVTQFGQADITDMEDFRKEQKEEFERMGLKLTPLVFIMKAVVAALKQYPYFNASLDENGENLILKKYFNLGIAVDTPNGLVVPVIREVDQKGMVDLVKELTDISNKARQKGLSPAEMSGSCFTISSLGGIGGTAFTPIINAPDVAILGVSKAIITPVYDQEQFIPRLMLPLSLSYDHRVIDGADGARFIVALAHLLSDIRTLLL